MYQLQHDIAETSKGERAFHLYLSTLKSLCDEEDVVFELLGGLKNDFKNICSILMKQPLLAFNMCAIMQREETRRRVLQGTMEEKNNILQITQATFPAHHDEAENNAQVVALQTKTKNKYR